MGVLYMPFFDAADSGLSSITLSTAGESNIVIDLSAITSADEDSNQSSIFSQYHATSITSFDPEAVSRYDHYARSSYVVALQTAIRAAMTTATWPSPSFFLCQMDYATGLISLGYIQNFGVDWDGDWQNAIMLGFTGVTGLLEP